MRPFAARISRASCVLLPFVVLAGCARFQPATTGVTLPVARIAAPAAASATDAASGAWIDGMPSTIAKPLAGDAMGVEIHRLANGLTVYISTDRQTPRFASWIAVRAGSRHDPAASTGLAHYLEHMLFKGSDEFGTLDYGAEKGYLDKIASLYGELRTAADPGRRTELFAAIDDATQASARFAIPNELDRLYKELGIAGVNAFTDDEMTVYISDVPSNRFDAWATVEAERFEDAVFRLFYPELEAVYEEKNRTLDSPGRRVQEALVAHLFPRHPYGTQPTIGQVEHLKTPAYADMAAYYARWYVPNNVAILLAGDIDAARALPVLERLFAGWKPKPVGQPEPGELPKVAGRVETEIRAEGEEGLVIGWQTVPIDHPDQAALQVLDMLMDNTASGLLNLELELTQKLPEAGSGGNFWSETGLWMMNATIRQDQLLADAEGLLLGVLAKLKKGEFTQADVDAIVLHEEIREKSEIESNEGRVSRMLGSYIAGQPWQWQLAQDERLRQVSRADVIRVANAYLGDDRVVVLRRDGKPDLPKIDKPKITPVPIDPSRISPFAERVMALPASELEPVFLVAGEHYQRATLPAGGLIAVRNERNDLFSLSYEFERGARTEPLLCYALELLERSGAGPLAADDLQKRLYALGTSVGTSCDEEEMSIRLTGIDRNMVASLDLLKSWLGQPTFDGDTVAGLLKNTLSARRDATEDPQTLGAALRAYAWYADRSRYLALPSNETLAKATGETLGALIREVPNFAHRTLYFGPRPASAVGAVIGLGNAHRPVSARRPVRYRSATGSTIYFLHKDVAKAEVGVALPKAPLARDRRPAALLYSQYMGGGMDSLIFQEIREARGLAYSAWGGYREGERPTDDAGFVGVIQTQVDKTNDALTAYLELVQRHPLEADRLRSSKVALDQEIRTNRIEPRDRARQILAWDDQGESSDPRRWEWERVAALPTDVAAAFSAETGQGPVIISVIGDRARVDLAALAKLAEVVEVTPAQLFSYGPFE